MTPEITIDSDTGWLSHQPEHELLTENTLTSTDEADLEITGGVKSIELDTEERTVFVESTVLQNVDNMEYPRNQYELTYLPYINIFEVRDGDNRILNSLNSAGAIKRRNPSVAIRDVTNLTIGVAENIDQYTGIGKVRTISSIYERAHV